MTSYPEFVFEKWETCSFNESIEKYSTLIKY